MKNTAHDLRLRLAASTVDSVKGTISGATVAKANVPAIGKFIFQRADGSLTLEAKGSVKKLGVATDDQTLATMMAAINQAGGRLKVRVDHDDSIDSRVGYATTFRHEADRIICDIHVFDASPHRALVLETADKDSANVGLSIDFTPRFEVIDGVAYMRAESIRAVDVVDAGAITPDGLFLSAAVDSQPEGNKAITPPKIKSPDTMPDEKKEPTMTEVMTALAALASQVGQCVAKLAEKPADAPVAPVAPDECELSAAQLAAVKTLVEAQVGTLKADFGKLNSALGIKADTTRLAAGNDTNSAAEKPKTFLELVDAEVSANAGKLSRSDASRSLMRKNPDSYRAYLAQKGVIKLA